MLTKLRIQNFKCWKDTGEDTDDDMRMAPLTVFFGANSSGKSSIGQFLMLLKQTVEFADRKAVLYFGGQNPAVELGSYKDMIYAHDPSHDLKFAYEWGCKDRLDFQDSGTRYRYDAMHFSAAIGQDPKTKRMFVKHFHYQMGGDADALKIGMLADGESKSKYKINEPTGYDLKLAGRNWPLDAPVHFYAFPDLVSTRYQNAGFVADLNLQHQNLFASMSYLGPLRQKAMRVYSWSGSDPESVGYLGEQAVPAMLAAQERRLNLKAYRHRKKFAEIIVSELEQMGLADALEVRLLSPEKQLYEVKVATKYSKGRGNLHNDVLPDVGIGVAQVLPVLVQCFYAPPGSIIIMEQPEIHLHPSAQSALADVMIDAIHSGENNKARNIQLIIETHSEHFLRRLQLRIAQKEIEREEVAAYFVEPVDGRAKIKRLQFDVFGNIENWPKDFFGDEMADILGLAEARLKHYRAQTRAGR